MSSGFTFRYAEVVMPIKTARWDDPASPSDGHRLLITRYRPRGVAKSAETWHAWDKDLAPSVELHAAVYGKAGRTPLSWDVYRVRYLKEMRDRKDKIAALAARVRAGETITLLCSSQCVREDRCHRSLLKMLIERELENPG
jgi:uncharacterized protein YeaO (DUF488 family)